MDEIDRVQPSQTNPLRTFVACAVRAYLKNGENWYQGFHCISIVRQTASAGIAEDKAGQPRDQVWERGFFPDKQPTSILTIK